MKKNLLSLTSITILLLTACSSKKEETKREMVFLNDSLYRSNLNSDTAAIAKTDPSMKEYKPAPYKRPTQKTRKFENDNNLTIKNDQTTAPPAVTAPVALPAPEPAPLPSQNTSAPATEKDNGATASTGNTETTETETEKTVPKKEGVSKAVKGAVIGGVGGAVVGAVISKKSKGKAAVIGGILGAAGGYALGRKKDKADGRVSNLAGL